MPLCFSSPSFVLFLLSYLFFFSSLARPCALVVISPSDVFFRSVLSSLWMLTRDRRRTWRSHWAKGEEEERCNEWQCWMLGVDMWDWQVSFNHFNVSVRQDLLLHIIRGLHTHTHTFKTLIYFLPAHPSTWNMKILIKQICATWWFLCVKFVVLETEV